MTARRARGRSTAARTTKPARTSSSRSTTKARAPRARKPAPERPTPEPGSRIWVLDEVPFQEPVPGARYNKAIGFPVVNAPVLAGPAAAYRSKDYSLARWIEDDLNQAPSPVTTLPLMRPRADQLVDIAAVVNAHTAAQRGFFLTSETGTGKTIVSVRAAAAIAARRAQNRPGNILVLVNRPASICIPDFRRTIQAAGAGGHRWLITTVDRVHKVVPLKVAWDVVIVDEAHSYRAADARRSKARAQLIKASVANTSRAPFTIDMTATPGHTPPELTYLAPLLAQRTGEKPADWVKDFPAALRTHGLHFENGRYGPKWTEDPQERAWDTAWVRSVLERPPAVTAHRAAPWGPAPLDVLPVELDPARAAQYAAAWADYVEEMGLARRVGKSDKGRAAILRWRQKACHLRIPDVAAWASARLEEEAQVVLYTDFVTMGAEPLVEALDGMGVRVARIYGQDFEPAREIAEFASGRAPVAVTTVSASINLHAGAVGEDGTKATAAPRVGAMTTPLYSGIKGRQVIGRTHRDGQVSPWVIMTAAGTVEEDVARAMVSRFVASDGLAGADTAALRAVAEMLGAAWMPTSALDTDDATP